jgi:hypothetical protein
MRAIELLGISVDLNQFAPQSVPDQRSNLL